MSHVARFVKRERDVPGEPQDEGHGGFKGGRGNRARWAKGRPTRAAAGALAALLALACLFADVTSASAQTATKLVSNLGQRSSIQGRKIMAQPFRTGDNTDGYGLTSVEIALGPGIHGSTRKSVLVRIVPNGTDNRPDFSDASKIVTLTNPASITNGATNTFTAPAGTTRAGEHDLPCRHKQFGWNAERPPVCRAHALEKRGQRQSRRLVDRKHPVLAKQTDLNLGQQAPTESPGCGSTGRSRAQAPTRRSRVSRSRTGRRTFR